MKLNFEQIKSATLGAVQIKELDGYINFSRFTSEQISLYSNQEKPRKTITHPEIRIHSTAGIKLRFRTNSKTLSISALFSPCFCRGTYSMDVFEKDKLLGRMSNIDELPDFNFVGWGERDEERTQTFTLSEGDKEITIYFPYSSQAKIKEISLDDGSYLSPIKPDKILLAFGDSITHGYDTLISSNSYANKLADMLGYQIYNKAVGGEICFPELAKTKDDFTPDLITVAYGTNDWANITSDEFENNYREFLSNLTSTYPTTKIFTLAPIWRKEILTQEKVFGDFRLVNEIIEKLTLNYENVYHIDCFDFIPKDSKYFSDGRLHPNDSGFEYYAKKLYYKIIKLI